MNFNGVGVALVTPFQSNGEIDFESLRSLVNKTIDGGVDFLVALGTTAETPTLSTTEKKSILAFIKEVNQNRKPIVVGIGGNNTLQIVQDIEEYAQIGIDGILSVVPYYNKPSQEGLFQHFSAIAASTTLPIILYNVPGRSSANMLPTTTIRLSKAFENIVAIKEASGNLQQCMQLVQKAPSHFSVLSGDDDLTLAQIAIGMKGVISVAANAFPSTFTQMVHKALDGDFESARILHYQIIDAIELLFCEGNPTGIKCLLNLQGILENHLRLPLISASDDLQNKLSKYKSIS